MSAPASPPAGPASLVAEPQPDSTPLPLPRAKAIDAPASSQRKPRRPGRRVSLYLSPGTYLADRYQVIRVVGEGGMGVVYACRDQSGELCAVKRVVLPEANADESLSWFVAEAQALAALDHENIVRARDFGQLRDGTPYLVMDLVQGISLQQLLAQPIDWTLLWSLVDQVLSALSHAHARGVVHGDLKPANVVVEFDAEGRGRARLFDFGLAKRRRVDLDPRLGQRAAPSQPPSHAGTPGYMAPEQILGRASEISPATDLYALGCILYRVLAGRAPVAHARQPPLDFQAFHEPEPPIVPPHLPEGLLPLVLSLLEPKPWLRLDSAAEVRRRFAAFRPDAAASAEVLVPACAGETERAECPTTLETTARVEPATPGRQLFRLCRSHSWPPGLLGIRASPLFGREDACGWLRELYERVRAGATPRAAVLLTGEAGVGKSRLAERLCTNAEELGTGVALRGYRPHAFRARDPLALALSDFFELGGGALRILPTGLARRCDEGDLGIFVDWVLSSSDPLGQLTPAPGLPGCAARVFSAIAGDRVLVLWLDELSELGAETLALLRALPHLAPALRVLLLTTARPEALRAPGAAAALRELSAAFELSTLPIAPLEAHAAAAMLRAAHPIAHELALDLARASGGVPLAALQRLHTLAWEGNLA